MLEKIKTEYFKRFNTSTKQTTKVRDGLSLNLYSAVQKIRNRPRKKKNLNDSLSFGQATLPFSLSGATSFSLWATRGAHNPNLQGFITHAPHVHVCSQDLLGLPLSMNGMHKMQFFTSTPSTLITRVLIFGHMKLMQSTALKQKRLDLQSL